ncbi:type II secretion system protein [Magnetofaba australis]|uniref:Putative type II secretion system protein n=1 Tax=Magnetofaba australis IT-1 TaxID=1434232 RepID=A0A1Y2K5R6_9PROT|nr:prepilin-type N-terminal cleavage/methylation domain-containing protein [Magnetofaba australis]OSM04880.1 putative type II secretion system protein [Magnetofaba australis IT-1]
MSKHVNAIRSRFEKGFTLMEMAIVLVVIGLILGAVSIGKDLQRNSEYRKITNKFIGQWAQAYGQYYERTGVVVGDNVDSPSGKTSASQSAMVSSFENLGIKVPRGQSGTHEYQYLYFNSQGEPVTLEVIFEHQATSSNTAGGTLVGNLMRIQGVAPALYSALDSSIDGLVQYADGVFRCELNLNAGSTGNNQTATDTGQGDEADDVSTTTCWWKMQQ